MRKDGASMSYKYTFKDGYMCWYAHELSKQELRYEESIHGKCVSIIKWK